MKQQLVESHKIRQTEISALPDSWITNTPTVKMLPPQNHFFSLCFRKIQNCLNVGQLMNCPVTLTTVKARIDGLRQTDVPWFNCGCLFHVVSYEDISLSKSAFISHFPNSRYLSLTLLLSEYHKQNFAQVISTCQNQEHTQNFTQVISTC